MTSIRLFGRYATIFAILLTTTAMHATAATPPEQITGESMDAWLILYNADSSGLDANSNGTNDSVEWKDWFISTHGISHPRTLGLTDPDGYWYKEWAGMQENFASTSGLWGQVSDYLNTDTNGDEVVGILVGYNVPGIWDIYSRDPSGISIVHRRGAKSVASALMHVTASPPTAGRGYQTNPILIPADINYWTCHQVFPWSNLPTTGNITKKVLLDRGLNRVYITARIDGPSLEDAKDLTRRALAIMNGEVEIGPDETMWQDWVDDRTNLPYWSDLGAAVTAGHRDLRWSKFMFDGIIDFDSNGNKECSMLPCPPEVYPTRDIGMFGFEYVNGWAEDINNDGIGDRTFRTVCKSPPGMRMFAGTWSSWAGCTLRFRSTDPRPCLAYSNNPPLNPDYLTTNNLAWVDSQFTFNALWPDCDGDGQIDPVGGYAAVVGSATCEPGSAGFFNPGVFLERIRNGATLAEASLIASPRVHHSYEYVGDPFLKLPRPLPTDCNTNGVDDYREITAGSSLDSNSNGIPDECEADCDGNGLNNLCEVVRHYVPDCNHNVVPDLCDICDGNSTDCDLNETPDECDLAAGTATDLNTNGLADSCEDCNTNGIPDFLAEDCDLPDDFDHDGDVDLFDFAALQRCFGQAGMSLDPQCACAFDYGASLDDVIDLDDAINYVDHMDAIGGPNTAPTSCWQTWQDAYYENICPQMP
ncbi:MAG: hypothetical protein H6817_05310 [Phycisphaerales bacterium]|nr:hypothetical protein [Phycisphaerales bacterium]